jgi:hypothetical protein
MESTYPSKCVLGLAGRTMLVIATLALALPGLLAQTRGYSTQLTQMVPSTAAIPSDGVAVTLLGRGFKAGQTLVSSDPSVQVLSFQVASAGVASATLRVLPGARPGTVRLDIRDPFGRGTGWQDVIPRLVLVPSTALSAPLSVRDAAVVFPSPGTLLSPDEPLMVRGALVTSGSSTVIGRFLLDGMAFDQFTAVAGGGAPVAVSARIPVPYTGPGTHDLQVEVLSPQHFLSGAVRIVGADESRTALALLGPVEGSAASSPPLFRWTFVPGAAGYEVALVPQNGEGDRYRWRSTASEYEPSPVEWAQVKSGAYRWTVRPVFPGEALGASASARTLFVGGAQVELRLAPPTAGPRPGTLLLSWEGGPSGALYRLEFARGGERLFDALTRNPRYLLRLPASAGAIQVTVTALAPDGHPLGPPARGTAESPRSERYAEPSVRFAAGPVTVTAVTPGDGSAASLLRPPISARWQGSVDPDDEVLFLDTTDVTAMATFQLGSFTYTPVMDLSPGPHTVRLSLGTTDRTWTFTVSGGAPQPQGRPSSETGGEATPATAEKAPASKGLPTGFWTLQGALTYAGVSGSEPDQADTLRGTLTGQSDLGNGVGFFKSTVDGSWRHDLQDPEVTVNESRSWLLSGGAKGEKFSFDAQAGYGAAEILGGSQFLSTGPTRGASQLRLSSPAGEFGAYASFDDHIPGVGSATGAGEVRVQAASYALPLPSKDFDVRLLGLWSDRDATAYEPSATGHVLGALGTFRISPAFTLTLEAARSTRNPDAGDSVSGNAFRLGFSGTAAGLSYALNLRRVDGDFSNAANPGYNAGGVPDRQGGDLALSKSFGKLATSFDLQYAEDGVGGTGAVPSARHWQAHLGFAHPLGQVCAVALDLNGTRDRGGEDLSQGLPGVHRNQEGLALAFTQHAGRLSFAESYTGQRVRDSANPTSDVDLDSFVLSAGGTFTANLGLATTASLSRTDLPFGVGSTDVAVVSVSPSWTIPDAHLTLLPQYLYTRTKSDSGTADTRLDEYGLTVQWSPTFWRSFLALQGSALWSDDHGTSGTVQAGTTHRYLLSVSLRWGGGKGALNDRLAAPGTPATLGLLYSPVRPAGMTGLRYPFIPGAPFSAPGL